MSRWLVEMKFLVPVWSEVVFCSFAVELLLSRGCSFLSCKSTFLLPRLDPWQHLSVVCDLNFVFPASGAMFNRSLILKMSLPAFLWKAKFIHMGESGAREVSKTVANVLTKGFSIPTYDAFLSSCTLHSIFLMGLTGEMRKWEKY